PDDAAQRIASKVLSKPRREGHTRSVDQSGVSLVQPRFCFDQPQLKHQRLAKEAFAVMTYPDRKPARWKAVEGAEALAHQRLCFTQLRHSLLEEHEPEHPCADDR